MLLSDVAVYKNAGLLLRLIEELVGFGTVSLTYKDGDMVYDWTCKVDGKTYAGRDTIQRWRVAKFSGLVDMGEVAHEMAERWKFGMRRDTVDKPELKAPSVLSLGSCFVHANMYYMCLDISPILVVLQDHTGKSHTLEPEKVQMMLNSGSSITTERFDRESVVVYRTSEALWEPKFDEDLRI